MEIEKLKSLEVEQIIIGCMLDEEGTRYQVLERVKEDDFYYSKHQVLFKVIKSLSKQSKKIDLVVLLEELKNKNLIEEAGGITYVSEIATSLLSTLALSEYIELLKEYSFKRKLHDVSNYINTNLNKTPTELQQEVMDKLIKAVNDDNVKETPETQEEEYLEILEKRMNGEINSLKTGILGIDKNIGGFGAGDLITIFAFSGVGKTTLALQIALNNIRANKKVLFFSLEMGKEQIRDRLISNLTSIAFRKIKTGELEDTELNEVVKASSYLTSRKFLISEETELMNVINKIQIQVINNDIDIVFIDYINLITIPGYNKEEYCRIAECTRLLKKLSLKIKKPIVILAQGKQEQASKMSNQNMEVWHKVSVNDIAGGASIYRDSDIVLGMYRNVELDNKVVRENLKDKIDYNSKDPDINPESLGVLIKKSRASGKNIVFTKWKPSVYRIENWY